MVKFKKILFDLSFMISIVISNSFYVILNNNNRGAYKLITVIDKIVPFINYFIIPYIIWYPFIVVGLVYLYFRNRKNYFKSLISLNIGLIICYIIFYFFQTTVPRPIVIDNDIFSKLVRMIYSNDNPYNCFPSVHVITTYIVMRGLYISVKNKIINLIFQFTGLLIILSTVFVKQHVVLDIISAIIIGEVVIKLVDFINIKSIIFKRKSKEIEYND